MNNPFSHILASIHMIGLIHKKILSERDVHFRLKFVMNFLLLDYKNISRT